MRIADLVTLVRVVLVLLVAYFVLSRFSAAVILALIVLLFALDAADGYAAKKERKTTYGARLDIAGDRAIEYVFWILYTYIGLLPLYVVFIIVLRNSFADAFVLAKNRSFARMKTGLGRIASSHISRGAYGALKAITFTYLALVFVAAWPISVGYALVGATVTYSVIRGVAEVEDALRS